MCKIMEDLAIESREEGREEGLIEMAISSVKSLMDSLGKSPMEAIELLNVPEELRSRVLAALEG